MPAKHAASILLLSLALLAACASPPERHAVPAGREQEAIIPGIPQARIADVLVEDEVYSRLATILAQKRAAGIADDVPAAILALSGGGANGAYGAGVLVGWTREGSRPDFDVVTGISTGALMAPFAFLGSAYDPVLEKLYTGTSTSDILTRRSTLAALRGDAVSDSAPLRQQVASMVDAQLLAKIAEQHRRGRRLLVGTTNLDAGRGVLWDMGEIANSAQPTALQLFRDILVASASIPVAFPPVYFDVLVDGRTYREMHVDGGIAAQAFIYPLWMELGKLSEEAGLERKRSLYVIRNSTLQASSAVVKPTLGGIAGRSMAMLIKQQGLGDMIRIFATARRDGLDFHLAYIPQEVENTSSEPFDPVYMQSLFDLGYQKALAGEAWEQQLFSEYDQ